MNPTREEIERARAYVDNGLYDYFNKHLPDDTYKTIRSCLEAQLNADTDKEFFMRWLDRVKDKRCTFEAAYEVIKHYPSSPKE